MAPLIYPHNPLDILAQSVEQETAADGQIAAGFLFASVKNTGNALAIVGGVPLAAGEAKSYPFVGKGYQGINYVTNGTTLRIMKIL